MAKKSVDIRRDYDNVTNEIFSNAINERIDMLRAIVGVRDTLIWRMQYDTMEIVRDEKGESVYKDGQLVFKPYSPDAESEYDRQRYREMGIYKELIAYLEERAGV